MKKSLFVFLLFCFTVTVKSQGFVERFLSSNDAIEMLAAFAHPTNDFKNGYYSSSEDAVYINYYDGYHTVLRVHFNGYYFSDITVIKDNDWAPPFGFITGIKTILHNIFEDDIPEALHEVARAMGKTIADMNGKELTCLTLTGGLIEHIARN